MTIGPIPRELLERGVLKPATTHKSYIPKSNNTHETMQCLLGVPRGHTEYSMLFADKSDAPVKHVSARLSVLFAGWDGGGGGKLGPGGCPDPTPASLLPSSLIM